LTEQATARLRQGRIQRLWVGARGTARPKGRSGVGSWGGSSQPLPTS